MHQFFKDWTISQDDYGSVYAISPDQKYGIYFSDYSFRDAGTTRVDNEWVRFEPFLIGYSWIGRWKLKKELRHEIRRRANARTARAHV